MFSTIKSLRIFNSKLFYFGHSWEKLIEWLADNNDDDDDEGFEDEDWLIAMFIKLSLVSDQIYINLLVSSI